MELLGGDVQERSGCVLGARVQQQRGRTRAWAGRTAWPADPTAIIPATSGAATLQFRNSEPEAKPASRCRRLALGPVIPSSLHIEEPLDRPQAKEFCAHHENQARPRPRSLGRRAKSGRVL
jgi:hypothetical protein